MARARNIKPGFFTNDQLAELPALTRLFFAGLWTVCDRSGRVEDRPKKIKAEVMPYDDMDPDQALDQLRNSGFIARYESGGVRVIQVLTWEKHQNPHVKEAASTLPEQEQHSASIVQEQCSEQPLPERAGLIPDSGFLIPDSLPLIPSSVPNGTGAEAPPKSANDLTKDELWSAGKSLLMAAGMPKAQCGSFIGKLVNDYGGAVVVDAVRAAVVARPADPAEYIKAACQRMAGQRQPRSGKSPRMTDDERAAWSAAEGEKARQLLFGDTPVADFIDINSTGVSHEAV